MSLKPKFIITLATGCYVGYFPFAPGTLGSLIGIPFVWLLSTFHPVLLVFAILIFIAVSIRIAGEAETIFNQKDSGCIVIDEIAGMLVTFFLVPWSAQNILIGFVLFRIFDIVKPFPIRLIDKKLAGGAGVVLDDVVAGIYANVLLHLFIMLCP